MFILVLTRTSRPATELWVELLLGLVVAICGMMEMLVCFLGDALM